VPRRQVALSNTNLEILSLAHVSTASRTSLAAVIAACDANVARATATATLRDALREVAAGLSTFAAVFGDDDLA
jgi:hypothetical protein